MMTKRQGFGTRGSGSVPARVQRHSTRVCTAIAGLALNVAAIAQAGTVRLTADEAAARIAAVSDVAAAAGERVAASRSGVAAADSAVLPSVTASAAVARRSSVPEFRLPFAAPGQQPEVLVPDITTTYGASLRLAETLYAGGAIGGLRQATRHERDATSAAREQTLADLRLAARLAYWDAVRAQASLEAARAQEERARRLLDDTRALLDAGMAVQADVLAAQERVASARVAVIRGEAAAAKTIAQLRSLIHLDESDEIALADSLTGSLPPPPAALSELQRQALQRRPELAARSAQLAALHAREELAKAPARPTLGIAAQWDLARPNARYFPQSDLWKSSWSVGLQSSWTLFDGGKARADAAASRAMQGAAAREEQELERQIRLEVETRRFDFASALATVTAADAAHAAAEERERAARERHAAGLATMAEILDAEAQLAAAEQQQVDARAGSWMAAANLARAVGE